MFVIGRVIDAAIVIDAMIGGRRTFGIYSHEGEWQLKVNNEWAIASVDGDEIPQGSFQRRRLLHGSVVEILNCQTRELVHRFRVELG